MSKKGRSKKAKYSNMVFFIPTIVILAIVLFAFLSGYIGSNSTLNIQAVSSSRYGPSITLHAPFTEGTVKGNTPYNMTLSQGTYTVYFGAVNWYVTPDAKVVYLPGGTSYFVTGVYRPVLRVFDLTGNGINATGATAEHGVTPVVWLNSGVSSTTISIDGSQVTVMPGQNYTKVFSAPGTYNFNGPAGTFTGSVTVE